MNKVKMLSKGLKFKKITALLLTALIMLLVMGCGNSTAKPAANDAAQPEAEKTLVRVAALKGPTGMALVKMMEDDSQGNSVNDYEFSILGAPDEAVAMFTSGQADIVCVPSNVAATLFEKTNGNVSIINVNTLGVLYVLERGESIKSAEDLKGKTVYSTGQGATPEYVFNYILKENGLDVQNDLTVEYKSEHTELASLLAAGQADVAVLPQPFVTSVLAKNPDIRVALDLTQEWQKVAGADHPLAMGVTIVNAEFLANNQAAVDNFLTEMDASVAFTNGNLDEASSLIEKYEIMSANVAKAAVPACNIVSLQGEKMKTAVASFLEVMYNSNPKSIGGKLPDEKIYYIQ
jgi:NitT/TauT family transport system substrate-binding protein